MESIQIYTDSFQRGEEKGFTYFFKSLFPALLFYSFKITNNKEAADEITENSFIKIWKCHELFGHHERISSWLYATVQNDSITWLKERDQPASSPCDPVKNMDNDEGLLFDNCMINVQLAHELYRLLQTLPPRCRQVVDLHFLQGKTLKEIAVQLKMPFKAINNQRMKGMKLLRVVPGEN